MAVRPQCSVTINGGVQEIQQPGHPRAEHSGEDPAKQIRNLADDGGEHSVMEQLKLKAAAEFWETFDDIPQPPSDAEAQDDEDRHAGHAEEFEDQLAEHALVEITEEDVAEHRFRVTGKQPPHRLYRPVGATGGEWVGQAQAAVKLLSEEEASVINMKKCQTCGLHQPRDEQVCPQSIVKDV